MSALTRSRSFACGHGMLIIEHVSDQEQDLERGMYGRAVPVRPALCSRSSAACLRGHDLAIARGRSGYNRRYGLTEITCNACYALGDPLASWCLVDPTRQYGLTTAPTSGLVLVRIPPTTRGGVGQIALWIDGVAQADIDLAICGPCQRAVIEQVRSDVQRRGYGRVLVAAALTRAPPSQYRWSTTRIANNPVARAFGPAFPGRESSAIRTTAPTWTSSAAGRLPDW